MSVTTVVLMLISQSPFFSHQFPHDFFVLMLVLFDKKFTHF